MIKHSKEGKTELRVAPETPQLNKLPNFQSVITTQIFPTSDQGVHVVRFPVPQCHSALFPTNSDEGHRNPLRRGIQTCNLTLQQHVQELLAHLPVRSSKSTSPRRSFPAKSTNDSHRRLLVSSVIILDYLQV
ncbi:hypothetical protein ACS0TY_007889 [Phlomoides rotata]